MISISIFQILWSEDDVAPKCLPVQSSSKPLKCECLRTGTSACTCSCLFVKEGLCVREAGHLCAKEVFPALDITSCHSRQISRYPKIPLPDLRIFGYFWVPRYPDVHLYLPCRAVKQPMLPASHIYCQPLDEYLKYTQTHVSHLICVGSPV